MKIEIVQTRNFTKIAEGLFKKKMLSQVDFDDFLKKLAENPLDGDVIAGTGGVRKIRLKSISKGKSGGFRVCYYYFVEKGRIFLLLMYAKNEQEDLTVIEKNILKQFVGFLKGAKNG